MNVTFENFQKLAARTLKDLGNEEANLDHMYFGILDEVGEVSKLFKKALVKGEGVDRGELILEMGDLCFFIVGISTVRGENVKFEVHPIPMDYSVKKYLRLFVEFADIALRNPTTANYLLYLWTNFATKLELDVLDVLQKNIEKLAIRHGDKFREDSFENRDLEAERQVLTSKTNNNG